MNNRTKVVLGAIVAVFAISLIFRFVLLSQAGVSGGWIFYLGLPVGGIVAVLALLLRLGLFNLGETQRPHLAPLPAPGEASERLRDPLSD